MNNIHTTHRRGMMRAALVLFLLVLIAPKGWAWRTGEDTDTTRVLSANDRSRYQYFFLEALAQQEQHHWAAAFDLYRHALDINPNASESYFQIASIYFMLNQHDKALSCFEKATRLAPHNNDYLEYYGHMLISMEDYAHAIEVFEQLYQNNRSRTDILQLLYALYNESDQYDKMLGVLDRIERINGISQQTALNRLNIYETQGETAKSRKVLLDLVNKNPYDNSYKLMYGNWTLSKGNTKEAYSIFQKVLNEEPKNEMALFSMLDYYDEIKRTDKYMNLVHKILRDKDTDSDSRYFLVRQTLARLQEDSDTVQMEQICREALSVPQENADILALYAQMKEAYNYPQEQVMEIVKEMLRVEPDNEMAQNYLCMNFAQEEKYQDIIDLCHKTLPYNPERMELYYFQGFAQYQLHDTLGALSSFQKATGLVSEESDSAMVSDCYMLMGEIYKDQKQLEACYAAFDSCLVYSPQNDGAMNNYAYYLSINPHSDLQKAERLARTAVQHQPDNATFLDTYAWVLFQLKRYDDARSVISHALQCDSTLSNVVLEHAGDIYYQAGDTDRAVELWQKAAEKDPSNALLQRKIELRKYIAE